MSGRSRVSKQPRKTSRSPVKEFLFSKKGLILVVFILFIVIGISMIAKPSRQAPTQAIKTSESGSTEKVPSTTDKADTPSYKTVTPNNTSIEDLGGWQRVSPANSNPVFAYSDKIGSVPINVSQQPLPDSFKTNTDSHVAELAKKFSATTKFDAGTIKAYIGTSAKGPQSVIFSQNETLILIKSQKNIDMKAWVQYITSLK